jgi:hypothetical protein
MLRLCPDDRPPAGGGGGGRPAGPGPDEERLDCGELLEFFDAALQA